MLVLVGDVMVVKPPLIFGAGKLELLQQNNSWEMKFGDGNNSAMVIPRHA